MSLGGVQALDQAQINTISVAVKIFYPWRNASTYLYMPTAKLPKVTNNTFSISDRNIGGTNWNDQWNMVLTYSGDAVVRSPTNLRLQIRAPYNAPFAGYTYSSTGIDS